MARRRARSTSSVAPPSPERRRGWGFAVRGVLVLALLYVFLVGVGVLEDAIVALGPDVQDELFRSVRNPLGGLFVGILATVLVQSSSVTTSTMVGLVASGLLSVEAAVPMVMGANIGTTVTNTLASVGHLRRRNEFRAAFAAATVHDFFNLLAVAVLLPLELLTGILRRSAEAISSSLLGASGGTFDSPINAAVNAPVTWLARLGTDVVGDGVALGVVLLVVGLGLIFVALGAITKNMRVLIADRVEVALNQVLSRGGGALALLMGLLVTMAVQSSSITTSLLVPLAASGVLSLANAYPVTLGANIGTTVTALLASLATNRPEALTIALVHTLFNVAGVLLFYPVPAMRRIPVALASFGAEIAGRRRRLAIAYVVVMFIVVPAVGVLVLR